MAYNGSQWRIVVRTIQDVQKTYPAQFNAYETRFILDMTAKLDDLCSGKLDTTRIPGYLYKLEKRCGDIIKAMAGVPNESPEQPMTEEKERPMHTVTIVDDESLPVPADAPQAASAIDALAARAELMALMQKLQQDNQVALAQSLEKAMAYGQQMTRELIEQTKIQLANVGKPKIMAVQIDGKKNPLSKPATKHLPRLIINAKSGLNSMLIGPAGSGKTTAVEQLAEALGLPFSYLSCTAGASETWLYGRHTPNGFIKADFWIRYTEGGVMLLDEWDAADSNFALAVNAAIEQGYAYNPMNGEKAKRHPDFVLVAACNTFGKGGDMQYTGRNRLDASTLRRFIKIYVDYCPEVEALLCPDEALRTKLQAAREKITELKAQEIISTGCIEKAYRQVQAGVAVEDVIESLTLGWNADLIAQCGLTVEKKSKRKGKEA